MSGPCRLAAAAALALGCAAAPATSNAGAGAGGAPTPVASGARGARVDTAALGLVPPGYGSLRQSDVAVTVGLPGVLVRAIPLDESVIRLLSPDSYRALHDLREGHRAAIERAAARLGVERPSLWYISYFGLEPDARFTASDIDIVSGGRDFRPRDIVALTSGFDDGTVAQRQVQSAVYMFDRGIDPFQPLTFIAGSVSSSSWSSVIPVIARERALVRSRAGTP